MKQEKMLKKNSYSKRIVLLTGSNGQLGKALALELIKNDFLVYGLDIIIRLHIINQYLI
jgi:nucleoside-diphosphate-sugar epimerase